MFKAFTQLLFGSYIYQLQSEFDRFRYRLLSVLMVTGALLTLVFIAGSASSVNPIFGPHSTSMWLFTSSTLLFWLYLRAKPQHWLSVAWIYEVICLLEYTSALLFVPFDELRLLWFFVNVPGVFIILGIRAGWFVSIVSCLILWVSNQFMSAPYSTNAMATGLLSLLYLSFMFHAFVRQSLSYFQRMLAYNKILKRQANQDPLTGLLNARAFYERCDHLIKQCQSQHKSYSVVFIDLDHFKRVNDTYGHKAGDEVLKTVAQTLQQQCAKQGVLGRIGGEEFSLLLPETNASDADQQAQSLLDAIRSIEISVENVSFKITASLGVATCRLRSMRDIQEDSDAAMYLAKQQGRNRVVHFEQESELV